MRNWISFLLAMFLAACGAAPSTPPPDRADYPDLGPAPELAGDVWLNRDAPLRLADLRGRVVLVDMWTFG